MKQEEVSASIASLADKVSDYHSRLVAIEREFKQHTTTCSCHNTKEKKDKKEKS